MVDITKVVWVLTVGIATPDEIAIKRPQRNQTLLPRDRSRSFQGRAPTASSLSVPVMDFLGISR